MGAVPCVRPPAAARGLARGPPAAIGLARGLATEGDLARGLATKGDIVRGFAAVGDLAGGRGVPPVAAGRIVRLWGTSRKATGCLATVGRFT